MDSSPISPVAPSPDGSGTQVRRLEAPPGLGERRAAAAVEFALVTPVILILLMGVLEWGRILVGEVALVQVASDAALAGARTEVADDPYGVAHTRAVEGIAASNYPFDLADIRVTRVDLATGEALEVGIQVAHDPWVPFVPAPHSLYAASVARLEDQ